jgi:hypothetical protein
MDELKIIFVNESTGQSIISDSFTFGCIFGGFFVNYHYLGNSVVFQILFAVMALTLSCGKVSPKIKRMSPREALKYLSEKYGHAVADPVE